jgi:hypothetical protein
MTGEQLLHGLWAILPEIILLLLGILIVTIDLIKRGQLRGRSFGYLTIAGGLVALGVIVYQMLNGQPQPALAFAGMVRVDLFVQMFRMMFVVALILAALISLDVKGLKTNGEFYGLLIFSAVGMGFMAASNNIVMLYVGLETTRPDKQWEWGGKVENEMFLNAVENLLKAGFSRDQLGVYLLCGLPGQTPEEVAETIQAVARSGAQPYLCEYSPVPGTSMWKDACTVSCYDLEGEPLYHNNTFFACRRPDFSYEDLLRLKDLNREVRRRAPVKVGDVGHKSLEDV